MLRCLQLARLGEGFVAPNPMVGAVIVHDNKIIGEGYHEKFGGPHAEVNAIKSVENPELLKESTSTISISDYLYKKYSDVYGDNYMYFIIIT